jgi:uncharacterized protein
MTFSRDQPPRLVPDQPLPPYSYVPGRFPHPIRDPAGHSFGHRGVPLAEFSADQWSRCKPYLLGIDLFNHGFYWEAHESWEAVWQAARGEPLLADFLKALIKLAAAGVKLREQRFLGVLRHSVRALQLLTDVRNRWPFETTASEPPNLLGLPIDQLISQTQELVETPDWTPASADASPDEAMLLFLLRVVGR